MKDVLEVRMKDVLEVSLSTRLVEGQCGSDANSTLPSGFLATPKGGRGEGKGPHDRSSWIYQSTLATTGRHCLVACELSWDPCVVWCLCSQLQPLICSEAGWTPMHLLGSCSCIFSFHIDSAGLLLLFPVNACRIDLSMSPSPQICSILLCQALPRRKADPPKQGCSISGEDSSNRQPPPPEAGCTK